MKRGLNSIGMCILPIAMDAGFDLWLKDIAPSNELRKWFSHDPSKWQEFRKEYRHELKDKPDVIEDLKKKGSAWDSHPAVCGERY